MEKPSSALTRALVEFRKMQHGRWTERQKSVFRDIDQVMTFLFEVSQSVEGKESSARPHAREAVSAAADLYAGLVYIDDDFDS